MALASAGIGKSHATPSNGTSAESVSADAVIDKLQIGGEELVSIYKQMLEIRHFEEQCNRAFRTGKVGGYLHLYIGQEAVSQGVLHNCKPGDQVVSSYRDHAHCLVLGSDAGRVMAEILGRSTGVSHGKGGSMHLFDKEHGFAGGYGIVGGNIPIAVGIGWALKYKKTDNICVCYIGDGAMNSGAFHESLNMTALYKLPVLFVLENNGYAMGTSVERSHANTDLASRANSYNIPNSKVDGQNYFAVRSAAADVISRMRKDPYPYFLEAITYRYVGHGAADDVKTQSTYREQEEVEKWRARDPIAIVADVLKKRGLLDDNLAMAMDEAAVEFAHNAFLFADRSPQCSPEELTQDVYVD